MRIKKYAGLAKISLQDNLEYRFNFFTTFIFMIAPLFVHICLWTAIYLGIGLNAELAGYDFAMMITYTILGQLLDKFTCEVNLQLKVSEEIREGLISKYLLLPVSYFFTNVSFLITNRVIYFITLIIPYLMIIFGCRNIFLFNFDIFYLLMFTLSIAIAIFISFMINHLVALSTFWLKDVTSLYVFTQSTFSFLAGGYITLDLLPQWASSLLMNTPFPYMLYFPIAIFIKKFDYVQNIRYLIISLIWVVILLILNKVVWELGLKRYSSDGI